MARIAIVQGHPDANPTRFCRALAEAYAQGARGAGHEVRVIDVAALDFPIVREREAWEKGAAPAAIAAAQETLAWSEHIVILFPLWLGAMPALLKAFLEQVLRPGFAFRYGSGAMPDKLLKGRSARVVVTMGMPGLFYRWFYRAHSLKALERNILAFCGIGPVRDSVIGLVEGNAKRRDKWLATMRRLGAAGA